VQSPLPGLCALCCGHSLRFAQFSCPHWYGIVGSMTEQHGVRGLQGLAPLHSDISHATQYMAATLSLSRLTGHGVSHLCPLLLAAVTLFAVVGARPHLCTCYWRGAAARLPRSAGQRRLPCAKPNRHTIPQDTIPKCGIAAAARTRSTGGAYTPAGISSYPAASGDTGRRLKEMQRYAMVATMCALRHADSKLGHTLFCAVQPDERAYLQT
jgi:hypothetical protein